MTILSNVMYGVDRQSNQWCLQKIMMLPRTYNKKSIQGIEIKPTNESYNIIISDIYSSA